MFILAGKQVDAKASKVKCHTISMKDTPARTFGAYNVVLLYRCAHLNPIIEASSLKMTRYHIKVLIISSYGALHMSIFDLSHIRMQIGIKCYPSA